MINAHVRLCRGESAGEVGDVAVSRIWQGSAAAGVGGVTVEAPAVLGRELTLFHAGDASRNIPGMTHDTERTQLQLQGPRSHASRLVRIFLPVGLTVLLAAAGMGWLAYATHYQPLGPPGSDSGASGPHVGVVTDGILASEYVLVGPPGTRGWVLYSLADNGPFAVQLLGPDADVTDYAYRWAPPTVPGADGISQSPVLSDTRPFPVTLRPGQVIALFVLVTKPSCGQYTRWVVTDLAIRWTALRVHHETDIHLSAEDPINWPIALCYDQAALRHLQTPVG